MQNIETHTNKKEISFEIMRTVACFFVVAIHVFSSYFSLFNKIDYNSWIFADSVMSFSRFSVPLFVMISGALLLRKDIRISKALYKAGRFLLILILWSVAYILINHIYLAKQTLSGKQILTMFLNNQISSHLWYLYILIGIYITLPLIRVLIKNSDKKLQKYYLIVFLSFSLIKMLPLSLSTLFNLNIKLYLMVPLMDWTLGCLVLGYYINKHVQITKAKFILSVVTLFLLNIATISLTYIESFKRKSPIQTYYSNDYITTILSAMCVFITINYISKYISKKCLLAKFFSFIGSISLEIYLVHLMVKYFYEVKLQKYFDIFIPKLSLKYLFELMFVFILSIIIAYLIKFITNQVKKIIKGLSDKSSITA